MRVLLVDDDVSEFHLFRSRLATFPGPPGEVEWIGDYEEALGALLEGRHDVALIDYYLGSRDGLQMIREAIGRGCATPLILLTGRADREIDLAAMEAGASDFLPKEELTARAVERSIRHAIRHKQAEAALRASEAEARKLALVAARTENSVIITDASGRIEWVNEGFRRVTGFGLDEVMGRKPGEVLQGPGTDSGTVDWMRERLRAGEGFEVEVLNYAKDGRPCWLAIEVRPVLDPSGKLTNFVAIEADVTERKRAEEAERESSRSIGRILDRITDGFVALDTDWRFTFVNRKAEPLLGRSAVGLIGSDFWEAFPEAIGTAFEEQFRRAMADGVPVAFEEFYRPLGRWFTVHGYPSPDGLSLYLTDATDRIRSEEALRRNEAQYRLLAENSTDMITRHDPEGRFLYASPSSRHLLGFEPEELVGRSPFERIHPDDLAVTRENQRALLGSDEPRLFQYRMLAKDGRWRWIESTARAWRDPSTGEVVEVQCSSRDVGDRHDAEHEIRRLNDHLERRLGRMEALREVDSAITSGRGLPETLRIVVEQAVDQLGLDAAALHLFDEGHAIVHHARGGSPDGPVDAEGRPRAIARPPSADCCPTRTDPAPCSGPDSLATAGPGETPHRSIPLLVKGHANGILDVFGRSDVGLDQEAENFLETLAGQAAIAIDNAWLFDGLRATNARLTRAYEETIEGWARVLDLRDRETEGHSRRVTEMTVRLARGMGLGDGEIIHIRRGALLHDIGKMGVPDSILLKPGKLDEAEWEVMKRHPSLARDMLWPVVFLRPALEIPFSHHEKWDGSGYPLGISGEAIPFAARIFAAVDIWDALSHDRPYRPAWDRDRVVDYLRSISGSHLDPKVVGAFLPLVEGLEAPDPAGTPAEPEAPFALPATEPPPGREVVAAGAAPGPSRRWELPLHLAEKEPSILYAARES